MSTDDGKDLGGPVDWTSDVAKVLAETPDVPFRTDAREAEQARCDQFLADMPANLNRLGPFARELNFIKTPGLSGYLLCQPVEEIVSEDDQTGELRTYYYILTSQGIYAGIMREPISRAGLFGKGEWKVLKSKEGGIHGKTKDIMYELALNGNVRAWSDVTEDGRMKNIMLAIGGERGVGFGPGAVYQPYPGKYSEFDLVPVASTSEDNELFLDALKASLHFAAELNAQAHQTATATHAVIDAMDARLAARKNMVADVTAATPTAASIEDVPAED